MFNRPSSGYFRDIEIIIPSVCFFIWSLLLVFDDCILSHPFIFTLFYYRYFLSATQFQKVDYFLCSKSEALIDMALFSHLIPFRYECELSLGTHILYPDFTIRHPKTDDIYYWEHFGLMDNPSYCQNVSFKLQQYSLNGIIPSIQLITTYETGTHFLTFLTSKSFGILLP